MYCIAVHICVYNRVCIHTIALQCVYIHNANVLCVCIMGGSVSSTFACGNGWLAYTDNMPCAYSTMTRSPQSTRGGSLTLSPIIIVYIRYTYIHIYELCLRGWSFYAFVILLYRISLNKCCGISNSAEVRRYLATFPDFLASRLTQTFSILRVHTYS